jgi:hypothetical protein
VLRRLQVLCKAKAIGGLHLREDQGCQLHRLLMAKCSSSRSAINQVVGSRVVQEGKGMDGARNSCMYGASKGTHMATDGKSEEPDLSW